MPHRNGVDTGSDICRGRPARRESELTSERCLSARKWSSTTLIWRVRRETEAKAKPNGKTIDVKSLTATLFTLLLFSTPQARSEEPTRNQHATPPEHTLTGQVLLPSGSGSRGVEMLVTVTEMDRDPRVVWLLFDEQGRFSHTFRGSLTGVKVTAGIGAEVHRIDAADLPEADAAGRIDVGVIDLRDRLARHRMVLRAADGAAQGEVRVGMWFGPPPVGPSGEPVSLGSRQFPPVALGGEVEWLLSREAHSIYFLIERPSGSGREAEWRGGRQRLFGPFTAAEIPAELIMD